MKASRSGLLALAIVYLVWGSSFLGIRLAVGGENAFAPYALAAWRTLGAGVLLLGAALARGESLRVGWPALRWLALTGVILWVGGHTLVIWAERRLDSSLAALIFASSPLWGVLLDGLRGTGWAPVKLVPVALGFAGVALVLPPGAGLDGLWVDAGVLLLSALLWALGSVMGLGPARALPITVSTGIQLSAAGLFNFAWAGLAGELGTMPGARPLLAAVYLTLVGTVLAYLAYAHCMKELPVGWLMSFGYVNPVVAVLLGWLVLGEKIGARGLAGMALVIGSVVWLFAVPAARAGRVG